MNERHIILICKKTKYNSEKFALADVEELLKNQIV